MIRRKYIVLLLLGLAAAFSSCTREELTPGGGTGEAPDPEDFQQGYFTLNMEFPGRNIETRGGSDEERYMEEAWGREEENYIRRVRMVLYGAKITGKDENGDPVFDPDQQVVRYAFDFNIESEKDDLWIGYDPETYDDIYANIIARYRQYYFDNGTKIFVPEGSADWPAGQGKPHLYKTTDMGYFEDRENAPLGFITWARRVMIDEYRMMLILNPTSSEYVNAADQNPSLDLYKVTAIGQPLEEARKAVSLLQSDLRHRSKYGFAEDNYFLMTNLQELVPVTKEQLMPTEQLANENPIPVSVSRAVSKITVTRSRKVRGSIPTRNNDRIEVTQILPPGASARNFRFDLDATNKKSYWMRRMTNMRSWDGDKGEMEQPDNNYPPIFDLYAEDPNFGNTTDKSDNFGYLSHPDGTPELQYYMVKEIPENVQGEDFAYCLENTMDNESPQYPTRFIDRSDVLTMIWISCQYAPPGLIAGQSYYVWKDGTIAAPLMAGYIADTGTIPSISAFDGLAEAIQQANLAGFDLSPGHSFNRYGIKYYHNGVNYYPAVISHLDSVIEDPVTMKKTPGYTYYGAVRNFHYEIFIRTIYGQGIPTIEDIPDPTSENGNIELEILLNPWQVRDQSHIPGNPVTPPTNP